MTNGAVLHGCDVDFDPREMCSTDGGSVLAVNDSVTPRTLVKFNLSEQGEVKLERSDEINDAKLNNACGLTKIVSKGKKLVIITTMEEIDSETGEIVWKIEGEVDGKKIDPHGVCHDDVGHLYVADGSKLCQPMVK